MGIQLFCLLSLVSFSFALTSTSDFPITCTSEESDTCIQTSEIEIKISACGVGYSCSYAQLKSNSDLWQDEICVENAYEEEVDLCNDEDLTASVMPGHECCKDSNCYAGTCVDSMCTAFEEDDACTNSWYCGAGTYCSNSICVKSKGEDKACSTDEQCDVGYGCNKKVCTQIFSLPLHSLVDDKKYCTTNYMISSGKCDSIDPWVNNEKLDHPYKCSAGDVCQYRSAVKQTAIATEPCLFVGKQGYCGSYKNYMEDAIGDIFKDMQYDESNCAGDDLHSGTPLKLLQCGAISRDNYEAWYYTTIQNDYWGVYQSGALDECVQEIGLFDPDYSSSSYLLPGILLILLS